MHLIGANIKFFIKLFNFPEIYLLEIILKPELHT